jgi:pimeloyl-ACP methyl ester carboxylesterase
MLSVTAVSTAIALAAVSAAQQRISLTARDGGIVYADIYGNGRRGVVLAHGGRFNKESWAKQAGELARAGFRAAAIDFRGYGRSKGRGRADIYTAPLYLDVLAAVAYLRNFAALERPVVEQRYRNL